MINKNMVRNTIWFSLLVQTITGIVSLHGLFINLKEKDKILTDILALETVVQFVEMAFYVWMAYAIININNMTSRRYIDWVITTPTMLLSTIMFMKYQEYKEKEKEEIVTTKQFLQDNKNYSPYICRHTCASRLVMGGASLPLVMEWMGHTQWSTTLGYAHLAPSTLNSLAALLDGSKLKVIDASVETTGVEATAKLAGVSN